jgi:hypothetical protein
VASSELGHYVRFDEALVEGASSANDPLDTAIARAVTNNLDHLADQYGQVLINWVSPSSGDYFGIDEDTIEDERYYQLWRSAPFDMAVATFLSTATGELELQSYRCRCRMRLTSNHGSVSASFRAVLAPEGTLTGEAALQTDTIPNATAAVAITSASAAWHNASSLIYLDAEGVRLATKRVTTVDSIGGTDVEPKWLRAQLTVYAKRTSSSAAPRLSGVHLSQYYEPP